MILHSASLRPMLILMGLVLLLTPTLCGQVHEAPIDEADREHWSLQPLLRPMPPETTFGSNSPVDSFIQRRLQRQGVQLQPQASRARLLRRLSFDLLGTPPSPQQLSDFLDDSRPDAYQRLVEQFLASPEYGERWAQHWLDLARFAETDGFEHDKTRKRAWAYRDWVIDALNAGMSYDRFVTQQVAGDLLPEYAEAEAIPTMFCLAGPDMPDINEQDLRRHDKLNEVTSTIGAALLGLQLHCAQCHDHKYDPISQLDFYRLRAVFESSIPRMIRDRHVLVLEEQASPIAARFYHRGELDGASEEVQPGVPRLAVPANQRYLCDDAAPPRLEFAEWLFAPENPLTARVIANRIWMHHFGQSLCENPSDFGVIAGGPSHPQLLDWLACELRDNNWSIKHLHRTILLSRVYQQAGVLDGEEVSATAMQESYCGFPTRRLDGEAIRDAMLMISGRLDREMRGPSVFPPLPPEMVQTLLKNQWNTSLNPADHYRRSVYIFARRNLRYPVFDVFDRPDAGATCAMRGESTTPLQSLLLLNSQLTIDTAQQLSETLLALYPQAPQDKHDSFALIDATFRRILSRQSTMSEQQAMHELLTETPEYPDNFVAICVGLLNCNEFIYVD